MQRNSYAKQTLTNALILLFALAARCSNAGGTFYASMYGCTVHIPLFGSVGVGVGTA